MPEQRGRDGPNRLAPVIEALRAGKDEAAFGACSALLVETPRDPALNQVAALAALRTGRAGDAIVLSERALAHRPGHVPTIVLLGRAARASGDGAKAVAAFRRAARLAPDGAEAMFLLCAMLLEGGDPEAQALLDELLVRFPGEAAGWEEVGQVLSRAGKREAALLCFSRAARAAPSFALAMRRGLILRDLGRTGEATDAFTQAVAADPRSARAAFLLGLCRQDRGDLAAAARAYRAALDADPTLAEAAVNLGTALQEAGDLDAAKAAYGRAIAIRPDTFGRIAQAMTTAAKGELWLDLGKLRASLAG